MHPELLNNSLFLRYYRQWQENPSSVVFAPICEYFLRYGMIDEALHVCGEGTKQHPNLVSGHLVMAKVHIAQGDRDRAMQSVQTVLSIVSDNESALMLKRQIEDSSAGPEDADLQQAKVVPIRKRETRRIPSWETVTMANIYTAQGHYDRARDIYNSILSRDPGNEAAMKGLEFLSARAGE